MSNFRHFVVTTGLILTFVGLIVYSDTEIWNSGYSPLEMELPDEFIALNMMGIETGLNKSIAVNTDVIYDFKSELNITGHQWGIRWDYMFDGVELWSIRNFLGMNYFSEFYNYWDKEQLSDAWDNDNNASLIDVDLYFRDLTLVFEDTNRTRNNIEDAYDDGSMYCTMVIPDRDETGDGYYSARDIVFSLLSFRLPSVFNDIHPLFAHMVSIIFYTQLAYLFFMLLTSLLHGGA